MEGYPSKTLSVIICAYNEEKTISCKIEDILAKDKNGKVQEIIIADDYSSDKTFEIAQNYSKNIKKVIVIKNRYKEGKWGAILTGFKYAQSEIICITDTDVIFQEDTLEKALGLFNDPAVGGVTSNQKIALIRNGKEGVPSVGFYEKFRNFFRTIESKIDSTMAFHGQCMFFRKKYLQLNATNAMADDLDIAIRIRRDGYRTLFCKDSYYIEKMPDFFDAISRRIFRRRARAVAQTIIKHSDVLFNSRYKKFGLICFPIEFFINIIFPFIIIVTLWGATVSILLLADRYKFLIIFYLFFLFLNHKFLIMAWYQINAVISYLLQPRSRCIRWTTSRYISVSSCQDVDRDNYDSAIDKKLKPIKD